jgi:hypothetical protein
LYYEEVLFNTHLYYISALFFSCSDELNTSDSLDNYKESEMAPVNQGDRAILLDKNDIVVAHT